MNNPIACPCLMIAAPSSGSGKTTLTAALARWHTRQGRKVRIFKAGPDFIDPMILQQACGAPVYSLDLGMMSEQHCRQLLHHAASEADLILIEGVMGLFDGKFSAALIARRFQIPVAIVVDVRAMAESFAAVVHGLASLDPTLDIWGCIANRAASPRHGEMVSDACRELIPHIPCRAVLRYNAEMAFPERHLGLLQAQEIQHLDDKLDQAAAQLEGTALTELPPPVNFEAPATTTVTEPALQGKTIAVARDAAFSFVYAANLDFLREQGAELRFVSPLNDNELPPCDMLYLPGGYPELHTEALSGNQAFLDAVFGFKGPILAECGGMIYLSESLTQLDGKQFELCGALPIRITMRDKLQALGWQKMATSQGELLAHTFHYSSAVIGDEQLISDRASNHAGEPGEPIFRQHNITASYLHWYFYSNPAAALALFGVAP